MREYQIAYRSRAGLGLDFNVHALNRADAVKFFKRHYSQTAKLLSAKETKASKIENKLIKAAIKSMPPPPPLSEGEAFRQMLRQAEKEWRADPKSGIAITRYLSLLLAGGEDDRTIRKTVEIMCRRVDMLNSTKG